MLEPWPICPRCFKEAGPTTHNCRDAEIAALKAQRDRYHAAANKASDAWERAVADRRAAEARADSLREALQAAVGVLFALPKSALSARRAEVLAQARAALIPQETNS